jgi:iron complex transport system substrate-binding protein
MKFRLLWLLAAAACMQPAASSPLPSVLSINLCADQLVMLLADPSQVRALSSLSRDEEGSYFHERAQKFAQAEPLAEDILPRSPDVVVTGTFNSRYTLSLLDELGVNVETLEIADSIESMFDNIQQMGDILHQQARAASLIAGLRQRLAEIDSRVALLDAAMLSRGATAPRAAVYDANGYTVGMQSLRGEAMTRAGWHNVAADKGIQSYGVLALEDMVRLAPQALIESPYSQGNYSRGQVLADHPALRQAGLDPMIISLPSNQTICAGPWLIEIIEQLVDARERLRAEKS